MAGQILTCGPFELDPGTQVLRRDGTPVPLGLRAALIFQALLKRPGDVVTKSELMDAAWSGAAVEESNLSVQVAALRKALGDAPGGGEWIVTIPRIGYRFIGAEAAQPPSAHESDRRSIAVLPFENLSADPEQAFFADGLAEEIITTLSKLPGLLVMARNSSFAYRGTSVDVRKVADELDVRYVLAGSVRRGGERIRVSVQLADAETGGHLWAERYDRELNDVFAIQDEMTSQIVDALKLKLTPAEVAQATTGGTADIEALDLLLRGRALLFGPTQNLEVHKRAIDLLRRALERDPSYIEAYDSLCLAHLYDYVNRWTEDPDRSLTEAQRLADVAVALAPNDPAAHNSAASAANFARDFDRFRREAETALALNPHYHGGDFLRGMLSLLSEDTLAAIPHFERMLRRDPSLATTVLHLQLIGMAYFFAGRYETAIALFRERIVLVPDTDWSRGYLASALGHLGQVDEARRIWSDLMAINPKYDLADRLRHSAAVLPAHIEIVLDGARKAGLIDQP